MLIPAIGQGQGFFEDYEAPRSSAVELGLFLDAPWGNIPDDRRGDIMVESLYPQGGLLGGGGPPGGKTSKLAALAKARKEKAEAQKRLQQQSIGGEQKTAVSMLSRLSQKQSPPSATPTPSALTSPKGSLPKKVPENSVPSSLDAPLTVLSATPPDNPSKSLDRLTREKPEEQPLPDQIREKSIPILDLRAGPSKFALSMFGDRITSSYEVEITDVRMFSLPGPPQNSQATAFAGPSPDDVVVAAQSTSKGSEFSLLRA